MMATPFLLADGGESDHPTATQLFEQGMQQFSAGDLDSARATLRRVDTAQLSKEDRNKMFNALKALDDQALKQGDASTVLSEADEAAKAGQFARAASLYESVKGNAKASEQQKETASARLADLKSRQGGAAGNDRKAIDAAAADIKAGRLDAAEAKLKAVKAGGRDLGWFDNERVDHQLAEIAELRKKPVATVADAGEAPVAAEVKSAQGSDDAASTELKPPVPVAAEAAHAEEQGKPVPVLEAKPVEAPAPAVAKPAETPTVQKAAEPAPDAAAAAPAKSDLLSQAALLYSQQKVAEGKAAENSGQVRLAQQAYQEALRLDPKNAEAKAALDAVQTKLGQDSAPKTVLDSQLEASHLRAEAAVAEFRELMNRSESLRKSGNYSAASEAVSQAKVMLDRNERVLPPSQYRALRDEAVIASGKVAEEQRQSEIKQQQQIAERQKLEAAKSRENALQAQEEEVQRLLRRAMELRREQKYDQCLELINQAIFLSPNNAAAQAMKEMVEEARILTETRRLLSARSLQVALQSNENLTATIPYNDLMVFPADWPQLTFNRLHDLEAGTAESKVNQRVNDKLLEPIRTIDLQSNRLVNVIEFLKSATGLNFFVNWNALQQIGVEQDTAVTLQLENVPAKKVLELVLSQVPSTDESNPISYSIIDGIITISTRKDLTRTTSIRVYDIRDLLHRIDPVKDAPRFDLSSALESSSSGSSGGGGSSKSIFEDTATKVDEPVDRSKLIEEITTLIQDQVGKPDEWASAGGEVSSLRELNGNLIIKTTPENHRGVLELLGKLRETRAMQISVEARFLLVDQNFLDELNVDLDIQINNPGANFGPIRIAQSSDAIAGRNNTGIPASLGAIQTNSPGVYVPGRGYADTGRSFDLGVSYMDDVQVNLVLNATQAHRRSISLTAPRVTFLNGQEAFVTVARQIAFVSDLTPVPGGTGFDPTLSIVQSGATLFVRGTVSADRRYVTLTVRPSLATVLQPIRTIPQSAQSTTTTGNNGGGNSTPIVTEAFIEAPELELTEVVTTVSVPDKGTLLLGGQRLVGETEVEAGVPILSKIPILNRFTTNRSSTKDERTLLILVKPTIIIQAEEEEQLFPGLLQNPAQYNVGRSFH
ncbi:MAG: hypothetical protein K8S99_02435 [Planctomycetes bacterium]|nr:hypothetical protein [Planctomycetota bacterium]